MIVFKTFLKILNKYKGILILYTVLLVGFGAFSLQTNETTTSFTAEKPDILIINQDENRGMTKNLIEYISKNANIKEIDQDNEYAVNDALFYRDINYIIYIPQGYHDEFLKGNNPTIEVKSTGDYQASYAEMMLNKYLKIASIYQKNITEEKELIEQINITLEKQSNVEITSQLNTDALAKATFYYNFANYSILAGCIYMICMVLASFKEEKVRRRTIVSSKDYKKLNRELLISNSLFAIALWAVYVILGCVLLGNVMFSIHGICYIINSFIFTMCAVTIAFLIGNIMTNKNAINGIVNVIALGSSFLCGAFVPAQWLPDSVLTIAHILPSYWYIQNNELIKTIEDFNIETLTPLITNALVILAFSVTFIIITNLITKKKLKRG